MSLQLERDSRAELQAHLDELTGRTTLIFAVIVGMTLLFSTQIDAWLDQLLTAINPCQTECLNLYDPARWSAVRWLSALLVAIAAASPLIMQQVWAFSNQGLLPSERKWMLRWMMGGCAVALIASVTTLIWLLPTTFGYGHDIQSEMGLVARYDAVLMLSIAVAVIWMQIVVCVAILGMAIAGQIGALNQNTADWWRLRCYGLVVLLLYASLPQFGGLAFLLIVTAVSCIEVACKPWFVQSANNDVEMVTIFDEEGGTRRPLLLECQCSGAAQALPSPLDLGLPHLSYAGLCNSIDEREQVLDWILATKTTDLIVTGCNADPISSKFRKNCSSVGASVRGMNLLERQSYRTQKPKHASLEFEIMLAQLANPWPDAQQVDRILTLISEHPNKSYVYTTGSTDQSWGQQLKPSEVLIHIEQRHVVEFERGIKQFTSNVRALRN